MRTKYLITFAGMPGTSKSPIAYYLSWNLGLPIINNDAIRTEVKEDLLELDKSEYEIRRRARVDLLVKSAKPFIYDTSADRTWATGVERLKAEGYEHFIISMDLSDELVRKLYTAKEYAHFFELFDQWHQDHKKFLEGHSDEVNLHINDEDFPRRLEMSLDAVRAWLETEV